MQIPESWSDEKIEKEVQEGLRQLFNSLKEFERGVIHPESSSQLDDIDYDPRHEVLAGFFKAARNIGYLDRPGTTEDFKYMGEEDVRLAHAFLETLGPQEHYFSVPSTTVCSKSLAAMYARSRVHASVGLSVSEEFLEGTFSPDFNVYEYDGLSSRELAVLADIGEQSVREALTRSEHFSLVKEKGKNSYLPMKDAISWLKSRRGFFIAHSERRKEIPGDALMVPVASDGSVLDFGCRQRHGFKFGPKGEEQYEETFGGVLKKLREYEGQGKPVYFRRPSPKSGVPGIVRAVRWEYRTKIELGVE